MAQVHVGAGRAGFSTGAAPVGFYTTLGGGHGASRRTVGSPSVAGYQRHYAQQYQAGLTKTEQARVLANEFLRIVNLHRVAFAPARPPVVAPPQQPDRVAIGRHAEQQALAGLSIFNVAGRRKARQQANAWAEGEVQRQWAEANQSNDQAQAYFDERWRQLRANAPDVVIETLEEAFEDNEVPSAAVGVDGSAVALVLLVPPVGMAVPERMPGTTPAGNVSLKKTTQRERDDYYKLYVCGQVLVTLREAFAVAPGLTSARVVVLRDEGSDAYGRAKVSCIFAGGFERLALDAVQWATADAVEIINAVSPDRLHNPTGRSNGLSPIDLADEPELAQLVQAVDLGDQTASEADKAGAASAPSVQVGRASVPMPSLGLPIARGAAANLNRRLALLSTPMSLLLTAGVVTAIAGCLWGVALAAGVAGGGGGVGVPATTTSSTTSAPAPRTSTAASVAPVVTTSVSLTVSTTTAPPPPPPPPARTSAPPPPATTSAPPPPPPPAAPPTQTGVHPGAFCSPHWAFGFTSTGVLMQCKPSATDTAFRWRQA